jgi:general secretion pathway protein K
MRGVALLLVMWVIALLASLIAAFALTARIESLQGLTLTRGLVAQQAARAGLEYALTRVAESDPKLQWVPDGRAYAWAFEDARVEVKMIDESGKIDLNAVDPSLLASLFVVLGSDRQQAQDLGMAIADWRDTDDLTQPQGGAEDPQYAAAGLPYGAKDAPFETVAEVEQVLGMTPALYARAAPFLTVYSGLGLPDQRFAGAEVLQAMGIDPAPILQQRANSATQPEGAPLLGSGSGTYSIDSRARLRDGRQAVLQAVVRAGFGGVPGSAYTTLRWEEGATPR